MRTISRKAAVVAGAAALLVAGGVAVATAAAGAGSDDAGEPALTGADLERASEAALAETGGGRVTATEVENEESGYEVEVTLDDGRQVDVQLDENFAVVDSTPDDEDGDR